MLAGNEAQCKRGDRYHQFESTAATASIPQATKAAILIKIAARAWEEDWRHAMEMAGEPWIRQPSGMWRDDFCMVALIDALRRRRERKARRISKTKSCVR